MTRALILQSKNPPPTFDSPTPLGAMVFLLLQWPMSLFYVQPYVGLHSEKYHLYFEPKTDYKDVKEFDLDVTLKKKGTFPIRNHF